ncbi:hypothetical protein pdam_00021410 [Pocillopora damicornis]|uniref:EGF-like domain-containing protein n=1 Tax=Pocillopora damicornis TaxID=46731 RepID=A0A3M6UW31_POCDA|nr:hypothetical protein pdam_00021410 [Pocillopora damicornis]
METIQEHIMVERGCLKKGKVHFTVSGKNDALVLYRRLQFHGPPAISSKPGVLREKHFHTIMETIQEHIMVERERLKKGNIDECASGVHNCRSSASCSNTVGSFKCSCNKAYIGDGRSCIPLPAERQNYQSLTGSDRKITYDNQNTVCDGGIHGAAGTRMPTSCPPIRRCNAHASIC